MRATRVDDSSSGDGLPSHRHIDTVGRRVVIPDTATGISEQAISQGHAHLYFVELHDIRQRVRVPTRKSALRHTLRPRVVLRSSRSASESECPERLALFLPLCSAEGSDERALRRSQSRASNGSNQERCHEITNFHPVASHLAGTPPVDRVPVDSICALAHALDRSPHALSRITT
jgi:hypothetical protein